MAGNTKISLEAQARQILGKKVKTLRAQGLIPATVYGKGIEPSSIQIEARAFATMYRRAGKTALIDLQVGNVQQSVFVQDVQRHPITRVVLHADFKVVDLRVAIQVEVPVVAIGESPVVERGDALLNHVLNSVMVEALPAELPQHIEVDISILDELDKTISVADLPTGGGYRILADADQVVLSLSVVRAEEEAAPVEETPVEPELIRRPREDDDEAGE